MAYKIREELVGKRFLSVSGYKNNVKLGKISDWCWKAGVVRAATHKDNTNKELQVLVEYDDREWQRREWLNVHKPGVFHAFLVEKTLIWCSKSDSARSPCSNLAPALNFTAIVGGVELSCCKLEPIEFLRERTLAFRDPATFRPAQDFIRKWSDDPAVQEWTRAQDGQGIILATPSVLVGYRVQVYRSEGTTQWYTAVIVGYNEATRELTVTDDTVLEDHNEDPCLVQMRLIGDGVVESIMKGEDVGMTPRRSRSNFVFHHRTPPRGKKPAKTPKKAVERRTAVSRVPRAAKPPAQPPDRGKPEDPENRKAQSQLPADKEQDKEKRSKVRPRVKKREPLKKEDKKKRSKEDEKKELKVKEEDKKHEEQVKLEVEVSDVCNREEEVVQEPKEEREVKLPKGEPQEETAEGSPSIDDDDGPLPATSPFRMEDSVGGGLLRDDRSDSGVSSLRSAGSGDERSGSRSSALSTTPPPTQRKISEQVWREGMSQPPQGYPGGGPPSILIPPPLYPQLPPELWPGKRYPPLPATSAHLAPPSEEAERFAIRERDHYLRERQREQEVRELEKHKEKERAAEAKQRQERQEKQAAEQAVHKHFEESLRLAAQSKRNNMCWINSLPGPPGSRSEEERKQQSQHQQAAQHQAQAHAAAAAAAAHDQQVRMAAAERIRQHDARDRAYYQQQVPQPRVTVSSKVEYPPPAHRGMKQVPEKPQAYTALPKADFSFFNYPRYQQLNFAENRNIFHEKPKELKVQAVDLPNPPPLMSDLKSSVIVKNDKSPGLDKIHSQSPKLRTEYLPPTAKSPFEYRSPSQSPHHLSQPSPGPHFDSPNLASISKVHMHRTQLLSPHPQQRQSPHQQRQSPHPQHRQSPHQHPQHPQHRQSPHHPPSPHLHPHPSPPGLVTTYSKPATVNSYPYPTAAVHYAPPTTPPKPRVSSPSMTVYNKPIRPMRNDGVSKPLTPSPYQQLSQHNLPPPHQLSQGSGLPPPPAAHAVTKTYSGPGLVNIKPLPPSSPPQMQPLDLGVKEDPQSPKRKAEDIADDLEIKKPKTEEEPILARVSEASPLLATAATTITTVLNTSLQQDRPQTPTKPTEPEKSNSPRPSYPVHKLKKAWLQRHSGEDTTENSSDIKGSGTCVTLPIPMPVPPSVPVVKKSDGVVNSIHSVGSMAVNSISLGKKPKVNRKGPKELNGHINVKTPEADDSSSSDPERKSTPQKRVPPKVKRKKGVRKTVPEEAKRKKTSVSSTESDKESGSEKESDSNNSTGSKKKEEKTKEGGKKRGRRPKSTPSKNGNEEESRKKIKEEDRSTPQRDPIQKPSVGLLKKTGESFLQDGPCFEVAPKLAKCRECRWTPNQRNRNMPNIFCRFYAFRRLRYTKNGQLAIAGFSDAHRDASQDDLKLWLPAEGISPPGLDVEMSKFLLAQVGDQFCDLLQQEKEAVSIHMSDDKTIAWKRVVQGVREMCDVCETTLFNFHWACGKCGFVVCIDCYKGRKNGTIKAWGEGGRDRDDLSWLLCTNRQAHEQEKLMLTQIIAGDSLNLLGQKIHGMRQVWGQQCHCECYENLSNGVSKETFKNSPKKKELNGDGRDKKENKDDNSTLSWLADVALSEDKKKTEIKEENEFTSDDEKDSNYSTLRELLIRPSGKSNGSRAPSPAKSQLETLDQVISTVIEHQVNKDDNKSELKHFIRKFRRVGGSNGVLQDPSLHVRIMTMTESKTLYPDVPHSWLCGGTLLRLLDSTNPQNYIAFQDQWKRGQPVLISDISKHLDDKLWSPESFSKDFGETKNDLINCVNGNTVPNQPMKKFWEGFESVGKRLKDERSNPMVLKLKDWPPGEDFAEMLPSRFNDLMKVLPMSEYTHRTGKLNLASRLPDCFVRPDLGPKMYTAYGSVTHPTAGTTNLHLDISDAVNVMVYVGIPHDVDQEQCCKEVYRAIDDAGCDLLTLRRVREKGQLPGALWHIYLARDADKIRDLLNKVALEKGARPEPHHDPIHDQSWYLDSSLRERLYKEYGVEGYSIVQCLGDAVFIPAGAPHQVRNLHNCIKVAEDFVSPENVSHCFHLTQEFRDLSETHTNHEDKLQIKNIMYHAVKDSVAVLEGSNENLTIKVKKEENGDS